MLNHENVESNFVSLEKLQAPKELADKIESVRNMIESDFGVELGELLVLGKEFGLELIGIGLKEVAEFTAAAGEYIEKSDAFQALGEFSPTLQEVAMTLGHWIQKGVEAIEPEHVARLIGIVLIAALSPEALGANPDFWKGVAEVAISVVQGAL